MQVDRWLQLIVWSPIAEFLPGYLECPHEYKVFRNVYISVLVHTTACVFDVVTDRELIFILIWLQVIA